ncbi:HAMP domain-containing sensor histidine kinase [Microbacterium oxydans]|uniref:Sensor-like histidine kinase SenX3 n=1 Tax=Microbacterium oxydans TaxID=82380 RepID=A0A3Q9J626_9MICO|nr:MULTISPECIES: HAMP domain-containing sensor histidine kinase [Microbacterium]AZS42040.1 Sensor histidine kinase WalK [Microbacterium oxydans]KAB1893114.1 HAMP domain-containing histidine kinase [Microbacterium oxydans]MBE7953037.1 HAMP domain-containing histidine kinase [Microbacterium sp. R1]GED37555.1 two-component sensor histidine kinase [Microbacterium oxydans]
MIVLAAPDVLLIVLTCLLAAVVVAALTLALLRMLRRRSVRAQLMLVASAGVVTMAASVVAIAVEMYISTHDLTVLLAVIGVSLVLGLATAWVAARAMRASFDRFSASLEEMGRGGVIVAGAGGSRELDGLSMQLAEVSAKVDAANAELERLDSARRRFFAWISHDLRTPLTAVRALAESIEDGAADAPERFAGQVRAQVETMSRMVDELFELSKLTSGAVQLQTQQVELLDVVSDAVADVAVAAAAHDVRIVERGVGGHVLWADPHQLGRIIVNLLTNAIRHAPRGTEIVISATEADRNRLVLGILDHGAGVAVEDLDRMFDVGWREDAARTSAGDQGGVASGAGLGLSIARGLARAHGGEVFAERTDEGFRMNVLLPFGGGGS